MTISTSNVSQKQELSWEQDGLPDLSADERAIGYRDLATYSSIFSFSARYWGGLWALIGSVVLIAFFAFLTTSEQVEERFMKWMERVQQSSGQDLFLLVGLPVSIASFSVLFYRWHSKKHPEARVVRAWILSAFTLFLASVSVKLNVAFALWSKSFYDAIQNRNEPEFWIQTGVFTVLAVFWVLVGTYRQFFQQLLQIRWRTWLTQIFSTQYFDKSRFYYLSQQSKQENPDQRIAEDLDKFTELAIYLYFGAYIAITSLYEFSKLMIEISGDLAFTRFGIDVIIPDYLFWTAVVYAIFGSIFISFVGRRLIKVEVLRQRYNAFFRYHLIRAREYAEGITFLRGELNHNNESRRLFGIVRSNWNTRMWALKFLGFSSLSYNQASVIVPILLMAPKYFADKAMTWGNFMQILRTFGELRESLSWFIDQYQNIAELRGTATRLFTLEKGMLEVDAFNERSPLIVTPNNVGGIALGHVSLNRPQFDDFGVMHEQPQVLGIDWQISQGQRWLVTGASGSGKSTILRAVAALWPYGKGHIDVPSKGKIQFLPQRPYFPIASLREALAYPAPADMYQDAAYETVLEMCQLSHLKTRLSEENTWGQVLSGGEQQRLAFARVFLQRPDYLFLDEATASLDIENEKTLYATLLEFLPNITLVSVSHHEQLKTYHTHALHLSADALGGFKAKTQTI
ncbi:ABC transporter ATP-binding protein [Formosimonas limnophila]|uniref:ABC transporter ATP-binding protein n=1 Tax=Formosimonas limnophila TaxID=1384487 RepID=A0A8J3CP38_9BURK|nr:ABC transporter ATP-binding protein/permease [Formosimonas limnophila]GHA78836.1 ABC transporter ATP-binding protein [Formosimonas limnophila]